MRGAANAVMSLSAADQKKGFATHSSGNHGQAVAMAAKLTGNTAYIVMPENAPKAKIAAVESYGGRITFCAPTETARQEACARIVEATERTLFLHLMIDGHLWASQLCQRNL